MTTGNSAQGFLETTAQSTGPSGAVAQAFVEAVANDAYLASGWAGQAFLEVVASTQAVPLPPVTPAPVIPQSLGGWRGSIGINWLGMALVGDAYSNVVGVADYDTFTEYGNTMQFLVTTPPLHQDRKRIFVSRFEIEVQAGQGQSDGSAAQMVLDVSKDGGETWQTLAEPRSMGAVGEYVKRLRWLGQGHARTWIFRLRCTDPVRRQIIGTYVDEKVGTG